MTDRLLISLADRVNEIYQQFSNDSNIKNIPAPRVSLIGTQSSGKSSVTNRIINYPLLPVGENMVTRTPVNVRLHYTESCPSMIAVLSVLENGELKEFFKTTINADEKIAKFELFRKKIAECTDSVTKNKHSISNIPLYIDIYSIKVPNFSFVDLPGQVATACEDKGQSESLMSEIESVIESQLSIPNTIALVVVQSKIDLETDIGVALVKKLAKKHKTFVTIGVMTKPDLLDSIDRDKLNDIIGGKIAGGTANLSKSVMMDEGFFVVNNKCESHAKETEYFLHNFDEAKEIISGEKFGISNLMNHCQKYLANSIRKMIPEIKSSLEDILKTQKIKSHHLGTELTDTHSKISYLGRVIYQLNKHIVNSLESNGTIPNVGSKIGKIIDTFVNEISKLNPFSDENMKDAYIENIIESFNGYHLTAQVSLEQIIERCITDRKLRPIMLISPISSICIRDIVCVLEDTVDKVIKCENIDSISSYPKLKSIITILLNSNIKEYAKETEKEIIKYLETEEEFFWSTSSDFRTTLKSLYLPKPSDEDKKKEVQQLPALFGDSFRQIAKSDRSNVVTTHYSYDVSQVRTLATEYFKTITNRGRDYIVKQIIVGIVKKLEKNITNDLNQLSVQNQSSIAELFVEDPVIAKERITVTNNIVKIEEILTMVSTYESS